MDLILHLREKAHLVWERHSTCMENNAAFCGNGKNNGKNFQDCSQLFIITDQSP
jgi:hypothetical protein